VDCFQSVISHLTATHRIEKQVCLFIPERGNDLLVGKHDPLDALLKRACEAEAVGWWQQRSGISHSEMIALLCLSIFIKAFTGG
jgi:hypothetical protein